MVVAGYMNIVKGQIHAEKMDAELPAVLCARKICAMSPVSFLVWLSWKRPGLSATRREGVETMEMFVHGKWMSASNRSRWLFDVNWLIQLIFQLLTLSTSGAMASKMAANKVRYTQVFLSGIFAR
jgi:hypothetical protein